MNIRKLGGIALLIGVNGAVLLSFLDDWAKGKQGDGNRCMFGHPSQPPSVASQFKPVLWKKVTMRNIWRFDRYERSGLSNYALLLITNSSTTPMTFNGFNTAGRDDSASLFAANLERMDRA